MGFGNYFKTSTTAPEDNVEAEKSSNNAVAPVVESAPPQTARPRSTRSYRSSTASIGDEAKHHVMLSYIFQHQQSCLWIADTSGDLEGAMLRKSRHNYLYSPPQLAFSPLAHAMDVLNVQVSLAVHYRREQPMNERY